MMQRNPLQRYGAFQKSFLICDTYIWVSVNSKRMKLTRFLQAKTKLFIKITLRNSSACRFLKDSTRIEDLFIKITMINLDFVNEFTRYRWSSRSFYYILRKLCAISKSVLQLVLLQGILLQMHAVQFYSTMFEHTLTTLKTHFLLTRMPLLYQKR